MKPLSALVMAFVFVLTACAHVPGSQKETKNYLEGDKKYMMAKICIYATHGGLRRMLENFENEDIRTLVAGCVDEGYLTAQRGTVKFIKDTSKAEHNRLGKIFEENNIWYYKEGADEKQTAGINLLNASKMTVSWVVLGFSPTECEATDSWETIMRVTIPKPLTGGQQAVLTWDMPESIKLANGCLDVLAAGK